MDDIINDDHAVCNGKLFWASCFCSLYACIQICWPEAIKKLVCYVIPFKTLEINISVKKNLFWFTVVL